MNDPQRPPNLSGELADLARCRRIPPRGDLENLLHRCIGTLEAQETRLRPMDSRGRPGGLIYLETGIPTVVVPDLHGRTGFLMAVLDMDLPAGQGKVLSALEAGLVQVVCVGDAFHAEGRARKRWAEALEEYYQGYRSHRAMDQEMNENLNLLAMVCHLKSAFPRQFHFLKGNHENVANEAGEGNHPFYKYAMEGEMVRQWLLQFHGTVLFDLVYKYEKTLALMAAGDGFLVTHCEPARGLDPRQVVDAYLDPQVIYDLTWTDNDQAEPGSVAATLEAFFPGRGNGTRIFGGHRLVSGAYNLRQDGRFVQINNPVWQVVAIINNAEEFDPVTGVTILTGPGDGLVSPGGGKP